RLATQLQRDGPQQLSAASRDLATRGRGAGEGDLVDARMLDQVGAELAPSRHDVHHAGRKLGLADRLGEQQAVQHRLRTRLDPDRATGGEQGRELEHPQTLGKFQGTIAPTTPTGLEITWIVPPSSPWRSSSRLVWRIKPA